MIENRSARYQLITGMMTTGAGYSEAMKEMIRVNRYFGNPQAVLINRGNGWEIVSLAWAKANKVGYELAW